MMRGMFSAICGLKTHQIMLDVTANDLANVNTVGYKGSRTTFKRLARPAPARRRRRPSAGSGGRNAAQVGLGVQLGSIDNIMGGGALQSTGNVARRRHPGRGLVPRRPRRRRRPPAGAPATATSSYTRAGNFTRNDQGYLVTQDGDYVIGTQRDAPAPAPRRLLHPASRRAPPTWRSATDGSVSYIRRRLRAATAGVARPRVAGYLSLAKFANEAGLERASATAGASAGSSGAERRRHARRATASARRIAGTVEMSNVDLATEFTTMITAQRGFQANSRVISTADEMLQDLVNLNR